jgi:hypothetical protein
VTVGRQTYVGTLKSNKNRTVVLPRSAIDALAVTAEGKGRDDLLWPPQTGSYFAPPAATESWLSGAGARCQRADPTSPPDDGACAAAHRRVAGHQRRGEPQGGVDGCWFTPAPR